MGTEVTEVVERKTPLYDTHVKYKGKIVPFAGYLLPVQYDTGVIGEHMGVRTRCGLFDVSHMGEIICRGKDALQNLNMLLTNDYTVMAEGQARYSPMCNEEGGVVDDLIVYKVRDNCYFIVVNAANKDKDYAWMKARQFGDVVFEDISDRVAQLALQGPKAMDVLKKVAKEEIPDKYYTCRFDCMIGDIRCIISRTGYTGEDGVEIYMAPEDAPGMWELLMDKGQEEGLIPCGLGARDTLRLEAAMPLYGHELNDVITPLEAGLDFAVKMGKEDFIGKNAIAARLPVRQTRVGLEITGRGIAREHQDIYIGDRLAGQTTSGTHCPFLGKAVAMAYLSSADAVPGTRVEVDVRGRRVAAQVVELPFYKR